MCGNYVVGDVLGIGGMGIVYAAVQSALDRTVALKLPRAEMADDPMVRWQFQVEAIAGARIRHRNVVGIVDFGQYHGAPFLVMEHVAGPRLGEMIVDEGPLPLRTAMVLVRQILAGLAEVHAAGVIHGDLKCDNVLVETLRDGTLVPRLIDFGLARFTSSPPVRIGGEQMVAGTPEYLAPELLRGAAPSFASDVYAMGIMCHELITGQTPFAGGSTAEVIQRQLHDLASPLSCRSPGVPDALEDLVGRALAKEPEARFASAATLGEALDAIDVVLYSGSRSGEEACPVLYASEATTSPMPIPPVERGPRLAAGTPGASSVRVGRRRAEVVTALHEGDLHHIVSSYLHLARALVDAHDLVTAIRELEEGLDLLDTGSLATRTAPVWRLQLTLAALYDGNGDRARACQTMREAHAVATRQGSTLGQQRALALFKRLVRRRDQGTTGRSK